MEALDNVGVPDTQTSAFYPLDAEGAPAASKANRKTVVQRKVTIFVCSVAADVVCI